MAGYRSNMSDYQTSVTGVEVYAMMIKNVSSGFRVMGLYQRRINSLDHGFGILN